MDRLDNISENEIRIIGSSPEQRPAETPQKGKKWLVVALVAALLVLGVALWLLSRNDSPSESFSTQSMPPVATEQGDSVVQDSAYVDICDTIINNISLHRYIPVNAKPMLVVGLIKDIPSDYILGAMAADFGDYNGEYRVAGAFVHQGQMLSHSKSKYGFCAILKDTVVIGNDLSTSYFEEAIEEKGDFFRQHALVHEGEVVNKVISKIGALRRSLCRLSDGRLCIIDTDMSVSLDEFSIALCQYGVKEAIALMGTGASVRWAVDKAGRRYIAGADEFDFPEVVNYIVWDGSRR
jgi:hypothetical protein